MTGATAGMHWYALKVFYNKVFEIENYLREESRQCYLPVRIEERIRQGETVRIRRPLISSLLFVRTDEQYIFDLKNRLNNRALVYTDRVSRCPVIIPDREMEIFITVTSVADKGLELYEDPSGGYHCGDRVRVTDGIFKGAEGYIRRIRGDKRLIVGIEGVVAVATSYIPACFLEKI